MRYYGLMTLSVAVSGATGYAGGEVLRLLASHPACRVQTVCAHSSAGEKLGQHAPNLHTYASMTIQASTAEQLQGHDVVFLALPHGASAPLAADLDPATLVIDAGADFRLRSAAAWQKYYGSAHAGSWPYGLPELIDVKGNKQRSQLIGAKRIAVPGCYPTAALLALAPGLAAHLLEAEDLVIVAASGTSGAGKSLKTQLLASEIGAGMLPYGVGGGHRHIPEIEQGLSQAAGQKVTLSFTPSLAPMPRGILLTATARAAAGCTEQRLRQVWQEAYAAEPFVHLLAPGQWPATKNVQGSNHVQLQLAYDEHSGRVIISAAIDNLVKGTAGGAIQAMNLSLGLEETLGLEQEGIRP